MKVIASTATARAAAATMAITMATSPSRAAVTKHSVMIAGHRTSISLEAAFWSALKRHAADRRMTIAALVAEIDAARDEANLCSAIRVFLLEAQNRVSDI